MAARPRLLYIAPAMPASGGSGLAMRLGMFLEGLVQAADIDLVILPAAGRAGTISPLCERLEILPTVLPADPADDTHFSLVMSLADVEMRRRAFAVYGRPTLSAFATVPAIVALRQHLEGQRYDGVHVARSYLLPLLDAWPATERPPVSVDLDEDDVATLQSIAGLHRLHGDEQRALWDELESAAFDRLLRRWLPFAGTAFIASEEDRLRVLSRQPGARIVVVPNGIAIPSARPVKKTSWNLLFVGGFGYAPNLDAGLWLCGSIWPRLKERFPSDSSPTLTLVGGGAPASLRDAAHARRIELAGAPEDLQPYYDRACLALVPIRASGGTRLKLLEAAAHGVPAVSTSRGTEGLRLEDGRHLWIRDDDEGFAEACSEALLDPDEANRRAREAAQIVRTHYNRDRIAFGIGQTVGAALEQMREKHGH